MKRKAVVIIVVAAVLLVLGGGSCLMGLQYKQKHTFVASSTKRQAKHKKKSKNLLKDMDVVQKDADVEKQEEAESEGYVTVNLCGYQFSISRKYNSYIDEKKGPIIYQDDVFYMLLNVRKDSFFKKCKNLDSFTKGVRKTGGKILKPVTTKKIKGKTYVYFTYTDGEYKFLVCGSQATGSDQRFAAVINMLDKKKKAESYLAIYAAITADAQQTTQPDTSAEELSRQNAEALIGEKKTKSTLKFHGKTVTFSVPKALYSQYADDTGSYATENFSNADYCLSVDVSLHYDQEGQCAKDVVASQLEYCVGDSDAKMQKTKVQKKQVDGRTIYYGMATYKSSGSQKQKLYAAYDMGKGYQYCVYASGTDYKGKITFDTLKKFFMIR